MSVLKRFSLPYSGMKDGFHQYEFAVDDTFFAQFEQNLIEKGNFIVEVKIDKKSNHSVLEMDINGFVACLCDRCLSEIQLPIHTDQTLFIKVGNPIDSDAEVVFIEEDLINLDISSIIYEFICLSIPLIKVYDCENEETPPCNKEILKYLNNNDTVDVKKNDGLEFFKDLNI